MLCPLNNHLTFPRRPHQVEHFHDVAELSVKDLAQLLYKHKLDVLVNLNGYTKVGQASDDVTRWWWLLLLTRVRHNNNPGCSQRSIRASASTDTVHVSWLSSLKRRTVHAGSHQPSLSLLLAWVGCLMPCCCCTLLAAVLCVR